MNKVNLVGRLTRNPDVRMSAGDNPTAIARFSVAVDRRFKKDGEATADFISCVAFGKSAEFVEKYFKQADGITVSGRIQTGSYTNKDGVKVYTTEVMVEDIGFVPSRGSANAASAGANAQPESNDVASGFMNIPDGINEELPFN